MFVEINGARLNVEILGEGPNKPVILTIQAPTLVTVGRADWVTPVASSEVIANGIPNSRLVIFEKSGHSPQFEEYELFQQVQRQFLADFVPHLFSA